MPKLREEYGVERIALYGSFASGTATEKSDVDLIVHLSRPLGLEFITLGEHLEKMLGRKVDLVTYETFRRSRQYPRYRAIVSNIERTLTYVESET